MAQFGQQSKITGFSRGARSAASATLSRPTVSPYLALTDFTGNGGVDASRNYFTQVRPRLNQIEDQRRAQQALVNIQQNVTAMRTAAIQQSRGQMHVTGHPTRFSLYQQYYPGFGR